MTYESFLHENGVDIKFGTSSDIVTNVSTDATNIVRFQAIHPSGFSFNGESFCEV